MPSNSSLSVVRPVSEHPIPFDPDEIEQVWAEHDALLEGDAPGVDEAHEEYTGTIAEYGAWRVFRAEWPFAMGGRIIFWNRELGEGFAIPDSEGDWHELVNVFAAVVDAEGDCRDAEYSSSTRASGMLNQRCGECGERWSA